MLGKLLRRAVGLSCFVVLTCDTVTAAEPVDFNRDIRPLLSNNCWQCHGPDESSRTGGDADGLRLDLRDHATADLGGYAALVPGKPDESELLRRIISDDDGEKMPPPETGKKLSTKDIDTIRRWIAEGGKFSQHWSYVKPVRPQVPTVKQTAWPRNAIDNFLLHRMEREGLAPSPEANRRMLIRRLSLDLTGLPPSPADVQEFLADKRPDAYEQLVDKLLARDAYGEHWARMWLDLARYADSAGYADDPPRTIWAYRDYVIRAFNENKRFDQFTIEQIAGDLLPNPTTEQLTATAFHRNTLTNNEGGTNDEEFRNVAVVDRVNTTMSVWMGTTIACCQCHTHKYDPLSQAEYFELFDFFNQSADADRRDESPRIDVFTAAQLQQKADWQREVAALQQTLKTPTPEVLKSQRDWETRMAAAVEWQRLPAKSVTSVNKTPLEVYGDIVGITKGTPTTKLPAQDTYTIELPITADSTLTGLRLVALPDASLPGGGPGTANGNFEITRLRAEVALPADRGVRGRYVRVELPGDGKMVSLAEVQVFAGDQNIATSGVAKQSSTGFSGPAKLAIDGNTNGDYNTAKSTTHTAVSKDPWWEVDLQQVSPVNRLVLWNRTDSNLQARLDGFRIQLLDENRQPVWQQEKQTGPKLSVEYNLGGPQPLAFTSVTADVAEAKHTADLLLSTDAKRKDGWAIGAKNVGKPHELTLSVPTPVELPAGAVLRVTIEQNSPRKQHLLGRLALEITSDARAAQWAQLPGDVQRLLRVPAGERTKSDAARLQDFYLTIAPTLKTQRDRLAKLTKQLVDFKPATTVPVMRDLPANKHRVTKVQIRGNFQQTGEVVKAGVPDIFPPLPAGQPVDRLVLAKWLVSEDNPLTARVVVNRYWEKVFGIGIVPTSEEFGSQGELPTHPELLDWLATEFVASGWDMKHLLRLMVTSSAYRQQSSASPDLLASDPDNRLLARGPRFRMTAEMVRDQTLFVSGLLSQKLYGPPVNPPQPRMGVNAAFGGGIDWKTSNGEDKYRRGLYTNWRRSNPYPSMATFDAPNREVCIVRRDRTNTPLQALVTLNDPVYVEAAQALARRIINEGGNTTAARAASAFEWCMIRPPTAKEQQRIVQLVETVKQRYADRKDDAMKLATDPLGPLPKGADVIDHAAWTLVANVLLNLDEMFMRP